MLYAFGHDINILIVAADTIAEYDRIPSFLEQNAIVYHVPDLATMVGNETFKGMGVPPFVLEEGHVPPARVKLISRKDALERQRAMLFESPSIDSIDEIYSLFAEQTSEPQASNYFDIPSSEIIQNGDRLVFATYCDSVHHTLALVSSESALKRMRKPLHEVYDSHARAGQTFALPKAFREEIAPGCFKFDGTPLGARSKLIDEGMCESICLVDFVQKNLSPEVSASTTDETAFALGLAPNPAPSDFIFSLRAHPTRASTFVVICPFDLWTTHHDLPSSIYLSPLFANFVERGYAERCPGIFEVLRSHDLVEEELLASGMVAHNSLIRPLKEYIESLGISRALTEPTKVDITWTESLDNWDQKSAICREKILPNKAVSFCLMEDVMGSTYAFFTSTADFSRTNSRTTIDLMLEERLPSAAVKMAPNIFRFEDVNAIMTQSQLVRSGFQDSYPLLLSTNMELFTTSLAEQIAFDPLE